MKKAHHYWEEQSARDIFVQHAAAMIMATRTNGTRSDVAANFAILDAEALADELERRHDRAVLEEPVA